MFILSQNKGPTAHRFAKVFNCPIIKPTELLIYIKSTMSLVQFNMAKESVRSLGSLLTNDKHPEVVFIRRGAEADFLMSIVFMLELYNVRTINSYASLITLRSKDLTAFKLIKAGFNVPTQVVLTSKNLIEFALDAFNLKDNPLIIKRTHGAQGQGINIAESKRSAASICETLLDHEQKIVLQEYTKGVEERALVYNTDVLGVVRRLPAKGKLRANLARGGTFEPIGNIPPKKIKLFQEVVKTLGVVFAAIDYIESEDGIISILEVNGSPGIQGFEKATGIDVPGFIKNKYF